MNMILELLSYNVVEHSRLFFINSHVKFIKRQTNDVAYSLAKATIFLSSFHLFIEMSDCIEAFIDNEMR
jgi:hypothetical protein